MKTLYEHRSHPLIPRIEFFFRVLRHSVVAFGIVLAALSLGVVGYHYLERLPWIDSLLNASMILGGMGPVDRLDTVAGKLFASFYALFSGLAFIGVIGVVLAPFAHRLLHRFHMEMDNSDSQTNSE